VHDVIIIGGGPIGSRTAFRLAEMNHSVLVLERNTTIGQKLSCTGILGAECMRRFNIKGVTLGEARSAKIFAPSGNMLRLYRPETQAAIIDRPSFDLKLAEKAMETGAEYLLDTSVAHIEVTPKGVQVFDGKSGKVYYAKAAVIATGHASLPQGNHGITKPLDFVMGAQAELPTAKSLDELEVYLGSSVAPGFFGWLVPTTEGKARVGLLARSDIKKHIEALISKLAESGKIEPSSEEIHFGTIPLNPPEHTYAERVLAVGDTAGQTKPTTGGGVYYGLLAADIAAEILQKAICKDNFSPYCLADYDKKWRKLLGREITTSYWARKFYERLSDDKIDRIFNRLKTGGLEQTLQDSEDISFDWHGKAIRKIAGNQMFSAVKNFFRAA